MSDELEILQTAEDETVQKLLTEAISLRQQGDFEGVSQLCSRIFHQETNQPGALYLLGTIDLQIGEYKQAVTRFREVLKACPEWAMAYNNLGNALQSIGVFDKAIDNYSQSLSLNSENAEVYNNLGNVYQRTGDYPVILSNLGAAFQACGKLEEAVVIYEKAINQMPQNYKAHNNLGTVLEDLRRFEEAEKSYRKSLAINPEYIEAYINLGNTLHALSRSEEAVSMYHKALDKAPDSFRAEHNLAVLYERNNDLERALTHTLKALDIKPDYYSAQITQAIILKRQDKLDQAKEILSSLKDKQLSHKDLGRVYFELGKISDHVHDIDTAYEYFIKANNLRRQFSSGDVEPEKALNDLEQDKKIFTKEFLESWTSDLDNTGQKNPVFLVGFPRSGTTLLDQILDAHSKLQVMEEQPALLELWVSLYNSPDGYHQSLAKMTQDEFVSLRQQYFSFVKRFIPWDESSVLVDQSPLNIIYIPLIKRLFPNAPIILALRHPCDAVLSCFMQDFKLNNSMANFFSLEESANFYDKVMSLWLQYKDILNLNYHIVKYEDVVEDFEKEIRGILTFLNLEWDSNILNYREHGDNRGRVSSASYAQVVQPIYDSSCYRWKLYEKHFEKVIKRLAPYVQAFQYSK
jgi:tetratricopeptide (TPR) repeat protein